MRRECRPVSTSSTAYVLRPCGNIPVEDSAVEYLVGDFGLVRGDLVARLEDAREGEGAVLARQVALGGSRVCLEGGVACGGERCLEGGGNG